MPAAWGFYLRPIRAEDQPFLWEMLYQAIYVPAGAPRPPREILREPALAHYARDWGREGDIGVLALETGTHRPVGAAWVRLLTGADRGYGYIDDQTPELSIAVLPDYRGRGIGTRLLAELLQAAQGHYGALSLSVTRGNPAVALYQRFGFTTVAEDGSSLTMRRASTAGPAPLWTETTTVSDYEVDLNRHWKPACFFQAMQQTATHHAASWGYDFDTLLAAGQVWVLSRLRIRFDDFPTPNETAVIRTWPKGISQRVFFLRDFEFRRPDGRSLAVATSAWLLIDPAARRILRPQTLGVDVPDNGGLTALAEPLERIAMPDDLPEALAVQAGYSAVDMMGHVNNARYVEWVCDTIPFDRYRSGRLRRLQINYLNETRPGERLLLRAGEHDGQWLVYGQNLDSSQRAFEAVAAF